MKTRTASEIQSLDDELNLFEENDWDFMSIVDAKGTNYEYFNDIRDADFDIKKREPLKFFAYSTAVVAVLTIMTLITLKVSNFADRSELEELQSMQNIGGVSTAHSSIEDGVEAAPDALVDISNVLGEYSICLWNKSDYADLDSYCATKSQFAKKYYEATNSVLTIYDVNDCYARGLREFASYFKIHRINRVVVKDNVYYCYATASYPTIYDVSEYIMGHTQSFVMKFQGGYNVSDATVAKFLLEVINEDAVTSSSNDVCIKLVKDGDEFKLLDDEFILTMASDDYTVAVNQLVKSLGGLLTN